MCVYVLVQVEVDSGIFIGHTPLCFLKCIYVYMTRKGD